MCTPRKVWKREYADCKNRYSNPVLFGLCHSKGSDRYAVQPILGSARLLQSGSCGKFRQTQHTHLHPATMDRYAGSPSNLFRDRRHAFQILETEPRSRTGRHFRNRRAILPSDFRSAICLQNQIMERSTQPRHTTGNARRTFRRHTSQHTHERLPSSHRRRNPHYRVARHVVRYVFRGMVHPPVVLRGNFGLTPQRAIDYL